MKKIYNPFVIVFFALFSQAVLAQPFSVGMTPQWQCYSAGNNTAIAVVTSTAVGASSYTWIVSGGSGTCTPIIAPISSGTMVTILYPCSGVFTIHCYAYASGNPIPLNNVVLTNTVLSAPLISIGGSTVFCQNSSAYLYATGANSYTWQPGNFNTISIAITPTASACYSVTGTTSLGCTNTAVRCITVTPSPTVTLTGGGGTVCPGTPVTFTASGANGYTWSAGTQTFSGNSVTLTPTGTTCFSVTGFNTTGCAKTTGTCITVQNNSVSISGPNSFCSGSSVTLTASGSQNYTWMPGNLTGTAIVVSPTANICYTVTSGIVSGCSGYATKCLSMSNPVISVGGGNSFCAGTTHTLYATGAASLTWMPFNITNSVVIFTPTANGCYTVTGLTSIGCSATATGCYSVTTSVTPSVTGNSSFCSGSYMTMSASGANSYTWLPSNSTNTVLYVYPSSNTCYTLLGNSGGCVGSAVHCVTVIPSPTISISGPTGICAGGSATLIATGSQNYTWMPGNLTGTTVVVTPSVNTCYTVSSNNGSGCSGTITRCVNVNGIPVISNIGGAFCLGTSHTLTASGATSYTWLPSNQTGASIIITPTASACYTIHGSTNAGCTGTTVSCFSVIPVPTISITGVSSVCAGSTLSLAGSGAYVYTWQPTNATTSIVVVTPTTSTCYTLTGYTGGGCFAKAIKCISVQTASLSTSVSSYSVCKGSSATFTASGCNTYTWSTGSNSPTINVLPLVTTVYTVIATGYNGCKDKNVVYVAVNQNCSDVWPGDANNDGVVSIIDAFEIGLAFNNTGPARNPGGNAYVAQFANNWAGTVSSGKNKCHADCNGSGTVNIADTLAIYNNFLLTHAFKPSEISSVNPDISLSPSYAFIAPGAWNSVDIVLADANSPMSQLYGVAFGLSFDQSLIEPDSAYITYTPSFLNSSDQNVQFRKGFFTNGIIYGASVRIDGINVNGNGKIGEFHFKAKNGLADNTELGLSLSGSSRVSSDGAQNGMSCGTATLILNHLVTGISQVKNAEHLLRFFPNPASNKVILQSDLQENVSYVLFDVTGREVSKGEFVSSKTLDVQSFDRGTYLLLMQSVSGSIHKKLVIEK